MQETSTDEINASRIGFMDLVLSHRVKAISELSKQMVNDCKLVLEDAPDKQGLTFIRYLTEKGLNYQDFNCIYTVFYHGQKGILQTGHMAFLDIPYINGLILHVACDMSDRALEIEKMLEYNGITVDML
ncbi:hypothetical protein EDD11_005329 [Mortierella claussenii]|nr:hypothetical protein EDD11_005329 [Mortierella claussenii]